MFPGGVEVALTAGASSGDEDLSGGEGTSRCVVLNLTIVDGSEGVAVGYRTQGEDLLPLPEEADLRGHFMTDLDEVFISSEGHDEDRELDHCGLVVPADCHLLY